MKRFFYVLLCCMFSVAMFADNAVCRVYGSKQQNVISVSNTVVMTPSNSTKVTVYLRNSKKEKCVVVLNIYDGDKLVQTEMVQYFGSEPEGYTKNVYISLPEKNKTYRVLIANATCSND